MQPHINKMYNSHTNTFEFGNVDNKSDYSSFSEVEIKNNYGFLMSVDDSDKRDEMIDKYHDTFSIKTNLNNASCNFCKRSHQIHMTFSQDEKETILKLLSNTPHMLRCAKCEKVYACVNCLNKLHNHSQTCHKIVPNIDIFSCLPNFDEDSFPRMDFTQLPEQYGGKIVNVHKIIYYKECRLIFFRDCGYVLFENRNGGYWLPYSKIMDKDYNKQLRCDKILSKVLAENYPRITYDKSFLSFLKHPDGYLIRLEHFSRQILMAVEYRGIQHYNYSQFYHGSEEGFRRMQEEDRLKDELCKENGVKLIVLPPECDTYESMKEYIFKRFFE